jgi:hypothetical protein
MIPHPFYHLSFIVGLVDCGLSTWYQNRSPGFHPPQPRISVVLIKFILTSEKSIRWDSDEYVYGPSTRLRPTCSRGNVGLRDKCPLAPSISPSCVYSRTDRGRSYNLVPDPRSWFQSPSATHFLLHIISPSLARSPYRGTLLSTHMVRARDRGLNTVGEILD